MTLTEKQRRIAKWAGLVVLALFTFVMVLHYTFPYDRVRDKIVDALNDKYDVTIASAEPTILPGGMVLKTMALRTRPDKPEELPTTIVIDELRVDIGLLALLGGAYDVDIEAVLGGGRIEGNVRMSDGGYHITVATSNLPLHNIPGLAGAVGLPMAGGLDADIDLDVPTGSWRDAKGHVKLSCLGCTVGDGKTKIKPPSRPGRFQGTAVFASQGITVPQLALGNFAANIQIDKGKGVVEHFAAKSQDGELVIDGELVFGSRLADSTLPGCMKFKFTEELKQREKDFGNLPMVMGVQLSSDGFANLRMTGKVTQLRWLPARECKPSGGEPSAEDSRPSITATPEPPERPSIPTASDDAAPVTGEFPPPEPNEMPIPPPSIEPPPPELEGPGNSGPELANPARAAGRRMDDVRLDPDREDPARPTDSAQPLQLQDDDDGYDGDDGPMDDQSVDEPYDGR